MKYLPGRVSESCLIRSSAVFKSSAASSHTGSPHWLPSGEPEKTSYAENRAMAYPRVLEFLLSEPTLRECKGQFNFQYQLILSAGAYSITSLAPSARRTPRPEIHDLRQAFAGQHRVRSFPSWGTIVLPIQVPPHSHGI